MSVVFPLRVSGVGWMPRPPHVPPPHPCPRASPALPAGRVRVLMRRDQVLKLACNHALAPGTSLQPLSTSDTAWCWSALDYASGEMQAEQLAVKFKVGARSRAPPPPNVRTSGIWSQGEIAEYLMIVGVAACSIVHI